MLFTDRRRCLPAGILITCPLRGGRVCICACARSSKAPIAGSHDKSCCQMSVCFFFFFFFFFSLCCHSDAVKGHFEMLSSKTLHGWMLVCVCVCVLTSVQLITFGCRIKCSNLVCCFYQRRKTAALECVCTGTQKHMNYTEGCNQS